MKQVAKETGKTNFEKMKSIARAYMRKRECSLQEAVYLLLPEFFEFFENLWINFSMIIEIFFNGTCQMTTFIGYMDSLCFVEFHSYHYVQSNTAEIENDCKPKVLNDELVEANHVSS